MVVSDAIAIVGVYIIADIFRCHFWMRTPWPEVIDGRWSSVRIHMTVLAFLPLIWPAILNALGWYAQKWRSWRWVVQNAVGAACALALSMAALALLLERELYPRAQIGLVAFLLPATTIGVRCISSWLGRWFGSRASHRILIVGTGRDAVRLRRLCQNVQVGRPSVLGHLRGPWEQATESDHAVEPLRILGEIEELGPILDREVVDEVIFAAPLDHLLEVLPFVSLCEEVGVTAHVQAESMTCHSIPEIANFHGVPLLAYAPTRHSAEWLAIKRAFDLLVASVAIVATGPIMLICAAVIKLTSPGPVLFRQRRSGLNGREFLMLKFRTMDLDAEKKQAEFAHLNESQGPVFKITNDPRVTAIGRLLRRWSLDELPQLFNVVKGDMSIVGPRPPIPSEVAKYDRWQRRRLSMRPGLTCIWQISGRHRVGFEEWMRMDLLYIDHWSLRLDLLIFFKTFATVLSGSGA